MRAKFLADACGDGRLRGGLRTEPERKSVNLVRRSANSLSVFNYNCDLASVHVTDVLQLNRDRHYSQYSTQRPESISALLDMLGGCGNYLSSRPMGVNVKFLTSLLLRSSDRQERARLGADVGEPSLFAALS